MDRHLLIAVSDQKSALNGVRFVGNFFTDNTLINATLFFSTPKGPLLFDSEKNLENISRQKEQEKKLLAKGEQVLENAGRMLFDKGFLQTNVTLKAQTQVFSKVADIITEGEKGSFDAVVLGRRGMSMLEEAFEESVSKTIFKEKITFPLWLCHTQDDAEKDILLYIDGSAASLKMADHVGFILSEDPKHHVDILAPESILSNTALMNQYVDALTGNGLDRNRIRRQSAVSGNPAKEILKTIEKNPYAAVAVGKSSSEGNLFSRLFKGPVCSVLFKEMKHSSLWLCP